MKFTLGALKAGRTPSVLGTCPEDTRIVQWANSAQERLLNCGRWWGTVVRAKFCVSDGCLVWPREVATIERINLCGTPISSNNLWYEFTQYVNPYCEDCCWRTDPRLVDLSNTPTVNEIDAGKKVVALATHADDVGKYIIVQGTDENNAWVRTADGTEEIDGEKIALALTPTVNEIDAGKKVVALATHADDVGKYIIVQGTDENNAWVRTADGTDVIDGEKIALALTPGTVSTTTFNTITGIDKDVTDYDVLLYQYDSTTATTEQLLGRYQPNEEYPDYRRSAVRNIANGCCTQEDCDNPVYTIEAICSLQHVPVSGDGDWFIIQNQSALQLAMQAEKLEEDDKDTEAEFKFKKAIRELQRQSEKYTPSTNARIITTGFGTAHPVKLFGGFI
jgi:general stress protein 26